MSHPGLWRAGLTSLLLCLSGMLYAEAKSDRALYQALSDCIEAQFETHAEPRSDLQVELAEQCPDLHKTLKANVWLREDLALAEQSLTLAELADLRFFVAGRLSTSGQSLKFDFERLPATLAAAYEPEQTLSETNWWQGLLNWLRQRKGDEQQADLRWLEQWLEDLTPSAATTKRLFQGLTAVLVILAVALIGHEIYLAKRGKPLWRRSLRARAATDPMQSVAADALSQPVRSETLPGLLNGCIEHLIANQRLPENRGKTNREFLHYLHTRQDPAAAAFAQLLERAEAVLYGGQQVDAATATACRAAASSLLQPLPPGAST